MVSATFLGPKPGERIGRFRIDAAWASGPFGPRASARMLASDRPAQLHCVRDVVPERDAADMAYEIARWHALVAPGLGRPIDVWIEPLGAIVALDDLPGTPLRERAGSLDVPAAVRAVRRAALALVPAHRAGLAHGALAPELILLERDGVGVSGLGVSAWLGPAALLRVAGSTLGGYLAPEQLAAAAATPQSDVHALAVVLHELIAGEASAPLPAHVPAGLRDVLAQATAKDPAARFEHADALARALEEHESVGRSTPRDASGSAAVASPPIKASPSASIASAPIAPGSIAPAPLEPAGPAAPRPRAARARVPRFSGALAHEQLAFARQRHGDGPVERALAALEPADRDEVANATPISWVRLEAFERFHEAFARELGRAVESTHPELVVGASRRTFNTLWRMLLRVGGTRLVMTRAPVVYSKTYDTGSMESRDVTDEGGRFVLSGWPDVPELVLRGLRAGMAVALENVGRTGVALSSTRTPDGAVFVARWDR